jgi:hypothetical protein
MPDERDISTTVAYCELCTGSHCRALFSNNSRGWDDRSVGPCVLGRFTTAIRPTQLIRAAARWDVMGVAERTRRKLEFIVSASKEHPGHVLCRNPDRAPSAWHHCFSVETSPSQPTGANPGKHGRGRFAPLDVSLGQWGKPRTLKDPVRVACGTDEHSLSKRRWTAGRLALDLRRAELRGATDRMWPLLR